MLAVVQIGSKTWRSPCSTARSVRASVGADCALSRPGADITAAVAALPLTVVAALPLRNERRDVAIGSTPSQAVSTARGRMSTIAGKRSDLGTGPWAQQEQSTKHQAEGAPRTSTRVPNRYAGYPAQRASVMCRREDAARRLDALTPAHARPQRLQHDQDRCRSSSPGSAAVAKPLKTASNACKQCQDQQRAVSDLAARSGSKQHHAAAGLPAV